MQKNSPHLHKIKFFELPISSHKMLMSVSQKKSKILHLRAYMEFLVKLRQGYAVHYLS